MPRGRGARACSIRLRAALYDYALFLLALVATLSLANAAGSASNAIFILGALLIALYDPVLVSWRGCTIGHLLCNLRVVDDRSRTNPSFAKSLVRFFIKTALGWLSFLTIFGSRRLKAIHDMATGTSLQVRDPARMKPSDFSEIDPA